MIPLCGYHFDEMALILKGDDYLSYQLMEVLEVMKS